MDQLNRSNKHRAEVIEIYENGLRAAVKFTSGRIECVVRRGMASNFELGMRGMVDYTRCLNGHEWTFEPFKNQSKIMDKSMEAMELDVINAAKELIEAMRREQDAMPKAYQAPDTVNAAGILLSKLKALGFVFPGSV